MNYIGFFENYKYIKAEDPIEKIWGFWLMRSDLNYLKRTWQNHSEEDYLYTSTCIKQAYEYYTASKALSLNTKPLVLYYCFLNLTKAALFIINDIKPNGNYHGLYEDTDNKTIAIGSSNDLLNFKALSNGGIFTDLTETLGKKFPIRTIFSMDDFLCNVIELRSQYLDYFNKNSLILTPTVNISFHGDIEVFFFDSDRLSEDTIAMIKHTFSSLDFSLENQNILRFKTTIKRSLQYDTDLINFLEPLFDFSVLSNTTYFYNSNPNKIPNASALFGIIFILGSIVRYHPEKLYHLIHEKDTSIHWMLSEICSLAERVYPNLMLDMIAQVKLKFGQGNEF